MKFRISVLPLACSGVSRVNTVVSSDWQDQKFLGSVGEIHVPRMTSVLGVSYDMAIAQNFWTQK